MNQEEYFEDLLARVLDNEMDEAEFQTFVEIIRLDGELRRRYEQEARVHALLSRLGNPSASGVIPAVAFWPRVWRYAVCAAACAALVAGVCAYQAGRCMSRAERSVPRAERPVPRAAAQNKPSFGPAPRAARSAPAVTPAAPPQQAQSLPPAAMVAAKHTKQEKKQMNKKQFVHTATAALALAAATPQKTAASAVKATASDGEASAVVTNLWTGAGDGISWADNNNWSDGSAPVSGEAVYISLSRNTVMSNNVENLSLAGLSVLFSSLENPTLSLQGNTLSVPDTGLDVFLSNVNCYVSAPLAGTGTVHVVSNSGKTFSLDAAASPFAGKWVVDNTLFQVTNALSLTAIGGATPEMPVADAVTLLHGATVKNYACSLDIPARIGFTLGEGGGGFICGWASYGMFTNIVNGPITGSGTLSFPQCVFPTVLANPSNDYTGGTVIGNNGNGSYTNLLSTVCMLGCDNAIPSNTAVTVDGAYNGVLDMNGRSLSLLSLTLLNNGLVINSASTQASLVAKDCSLAGTVADNINFTWEDFSFNVADRAVWTNRYFTISSGKTASVSNSAGVGGVAVKLAGGTLSFPATAGFSERHYSGNNIETDDKGIDRFTPATEMGSVTNKSLWNTNEGYYYQSLWYFPQDATYSFCKNFDDSARLDIDGGTFLNNTTAWTEQRNSTVFPAGWHEVRLWYANGGSSAGPGSGWTNGLVWTKASSVTKDNQKAFDSLNGEFTFVPTCSSPVYVGPGGGTLVVTPDATVTGTAPAAILRGGLVASADNTTNATVILASPTIIGNRGNMVSLFDASATLSENASLSFRNKVWVRRVPSCAYTIAPDTAVYLDKDSLSMTGVVVSANANVSVAFFNQSILPDLFSAGVSFTMRCSSSFLGLNPVEDSVAGVWTNDLPLASGTTLTITGTGNTRFSGALSGNGTVQVVGGVYNINFCGDNGAFSGTWQLVNGNLFATNAFALGSSSATVTVRGGALNLGDTSSRDFSFAPSFVIQGGTICVNCKSATVGSLTAARSDGLLNIVGGALCVAAEKLSLPNGVLSLPSAATLAVTVAQGETWNPGAIRGDGTLVIRGGGTISSDALIGFTGTLRLENGTLRNATSFAANPSFWLDASATASLVLSNDTSALEWHDVRDGTTSSNYPYCYLNGSIANYNAAGYKAAYPPTLYSDADALLPVLDFGKQNSGQWFFFSQGVPMQTVVFVLGSQNGGGPCWFGHTNSTAGIIRGGAVDDPVTTTNAIYSNASWANALFANSYTRVDGVSVNPAFTGINGGYQIFSTRISSSCTLNGLAKDIRSFASTTANNALRAGGMRFAEILFYARSLTDEEIAATENYLSKKWLGRALGTSSTDAQGLYAVEGGNTGKVQVDSAFTAQDVKGLAGGDTLAKTGPGTLTVNFSSSADTGTVELAEGGYSINGIAAQYASESLPDGLNPAFWVDANVASSYGTDEAGRFYWRDCRWDGVTDYVVATQRWSVAPSILTNDIESTLSVLTFGSLSTTHDRGLQWSKDLKAQAVFMLIGSQESGGIILGGDGAPFNRYDMVSYTNPLYTVSTGAPITNGVTRLDALGVDGMKTGFSGGYQVLTVVPTAAVTVGQFAHDRDLVATQKRDGGQRLGEVLIFTNALTFTQARQVEGYLMTRWLRPGNKHSSDSLNRLVTTGESNATRFVDTGMRTLALGTLAGGTSLAKKGAGTLTVADYGIFSNTLTLAAGTLSLPCGNLYAPPQDALFWVDASKASSLTLTNGNEVIRWADCRANGRYAARDVAYNQTVGAVTYTNPSPTLLENALNHRPVVDFGAWKSGEFLNWSAPITTIRTVFWVIGSQNGGGILLDYDKSDTSIRDFWRGGSGANDWAVTSYANPIWNATVSAPYTAVCNAPTRLNGADVNGGTAGLTGGYDLVVVRTTDNARASVFNNDRGRNYRDSTGGQRLAEVLIFDRVLTDDEVIQTEKYLAAKWGLSIATGTPATLGTSPMTIMMKSGSMLTLDKGIGTSFAGLGGVGTVTNGNVVVSALHQISAPADNAALTVSGALTVASNAVWTATLGTALPAPIEVAGAVTFLSGGKFTLTGASVLIGKKSCLLLKSSAITGFDRHAWKVETDDNKRAYLLQQTDQGILLKINPKGTVIMLM